MFGSVHDAGWMNDNLNLKKVVLYKEGGKKKKKRMIQL